MAKKQINMRLSQGTIDTLKELSHLGTGDEAGTMTGVVERIVSHWIYTNFLKNKNIWKVKLGSLTNKPDKICAFYAALKKAERNEPGYKIHRHDELGLKIEGDNTAGGEIIGIETPDPENPGGKILL